jgi:hypothetical protein
MNMADLLFWIVVAWIWAHELDAVQKHEWRLLPVMAQMNDVWGYRVFVLLHIPLLVWVAWAAGNPTFQIGFSVFVIVHGGLHWLLRKDPKYEFHDPLSYVLIFGAVPLAALHLLMQVL